MVGVAQLVERRIVIPVVVGSIPIVHPIFFEGALIVRSGAFVVSGVYAFRGMVSLRSSAARTARDFAGAQKAQAMSFATFTQSRPCNPLVAPQ